MITDRRVDLVSDVANLPPIKVGVVGCGNILPAYEQTFARFPTVDIVAVSDFDAVRSRAAADRLGAEVLPMESLLARPDIDTVLNLTPPGAHKAVSEAAILAGKNVFSEKPLALSVEDGDYLVRLAKERNVKLGCAPDTVLGVGVQSSAFYVQEGRVGQVTAASATLVLAGHELWHPDPDYFYLKGGSPVFDMGPYYLHALVSIVGPVTEVFAYSSRSRDFRTINSGPRQGEAFPVEVDTHQTALLQHSNGVISTVVMSYDGAGTTASPLEIHGTGGTLAVPDPNWFDGEPRLRVAGSKEWTELPVCAGYRDGSRGYGLIEMASSVSVDGHRADGAFGSHTLEIASGMVESSRTGSAVRIRPFERHSRPVQSAQ